MFNVMKQCETMQCAEVVEICILKCPTLANHFSVVVHPWCLKFCMELCELPKNLEKKKKKDLKRKKRKKMQKT